MILSCVYLIIQLISRSKLVLKRWFILMLLTPLLRCDGVVLKKRSEQNILRESELPVNNRPIIGILSQEVSPYLNGKYANENYTSYIAASYVKAVESAGARVVPIMIGKGRVYYEKLLTKLNGVLFPGGNSFFNHSNGYAETGKYIFDIAKGFNDAGQYFPIFGICLGFELLIILAADGVDNRNNCWSYQNSRLEFTKDFNNSKMFKEIPSDVVTILSHENVTINAHQFCFSDVDMQKYNVKNDWKVLSHSYDEKNTKFISSVEHTKYPFYGVQFHPEKSAFEWKESKHYASSKNAIKANRYFMDFFIDECRNSQHSFVDPEDENSHIIYNYEAKFTGILGSMFEQCYFFEPYPCVSTVSEIIQPTVFD